jgi:hypothetical protein
VGHGLECGVALFEYGELPLGIGEQAGEQLDDRGRAPDDELLLPPATPRGVEELADGHLARPGLGDPATATGQPVLDPKWLDAANLHRVVRLEQSPVRDAQPGRRG